MMQAKKGKDIDTMIRQAEMPITPSADFTDRVMAAIADKAHKGWQWIKMFYGLPTLAVLLILVVPVTRNEILGLVAPEQATVNSVQEEVDGMQAILLELVGDIEATELDNVK